MKIKGVMKKRKQKKNEKAKKKQEEKVKEYCRSFKEQNPEASDDVVLMYAFRTVYGPKGIEIMKRIKKDPEVYQGIQEDLQRIDELVSENNFEEVLEKEKEIERV